jgi:signal transduction histidine kinase
MTVANRLRGAFALYVASLVAVALLYARTVQRAADSGRAMTEIAERVRVTTDQLSRIDQMSADAEKYLITRDARYRDKFAAAYREFGQPDARAFQPAVLDSLRLRVQAAGAAAQAAMRRELIESERVAARAAEVAWIVAGVALVLGVLLSIALARSIARPLDRLARGTREISAGRFDYRLATEDTDEFSLVARDFNSMARRLAELDRMKKDFVARVSHDLKTPLSSMQEANSALLDEMAGPLSGTQRRLLELNMESGHRLSAMLGKLLDLSRIEAGAQPVLQVVDVNQVAKRSVDNASSGALHRGVRLSVVEPERPSLVRADAGAISQVLDNLIENAIKFSPADGEVRVAVAATPSEGEVVLTVADEGPGIPLGERDRIFDRFYQTDAGRSVRGRGVGLGLTICREIVSSHKGMIWVDANEPRGSVFHVLLRRGAAAVAGIMLLGTIGCAARHQSPAEPRPENLELRISELTSELAALRARLDSTTAQSDSLSLELQRLKEIDLRPRTVRRPPAED